MERARSVCAHRALSRFPEETSLVSFGPCEKRSQHDDTEPHGRERHEGGLQAEDVREHAHAGGAASMPKKLMVEMMEMATLGETVRLFEVSE